MKTLALLATLFLLPAAYAGSDYAAKLDQDLGGAQKILDDAQAGGQLSKCFPSQDAGGLSKGIAELRAKFAPDAKDYSAGADGWKAFLKKVAGDGATEAVSSDFVCNAAEQTRQTAVVFDDSMTRAEATFKGYCQQAQDLAKKFDASFSGHFLARMGSGCRDSANSVKAARKLLLDAGAQACENFLVEVSYAQDGAHNTNDALKRGCKDVQADEREHEIELDIRSNEHEKYMECYDKSGQTGWGCGDSR